MMQITRVVDVDCDLLNVEASVGRGIYTRRGNKIGVVSELRKGKGKRSEVLAVIDNPDVAAALLMGDDKSNTYKPNIDWEKTLVRKKERRS